MKWTDSYQDICAKLQIAQAYEQELRRRVEIAHAVVFDGEAQSSGREFCHVPLDKAMERYSKAVNELNDHQQEVDRLDDIKQEMDKALNGLGGLTNRILAGKLQGRRYRDMALEFGYSEQSLKNHMYRQRDFLSTDSAI